MKQAKASPEEAEQLLRWLQTQDEAGRNPPPYNRTVSGYLLMLYHCADPAKDYIDFKPGMSPIEIAEIKAGAQAAEARVKATEARVKGLEAQLKATMQAGGYEHFTAQVRNANQQAHNAIYVAQQLEKRVAELEAQNAELIAETHRWSAADKGATLQRDEQRRELIARAAATEARLKQQQAALEAAAAVFEALDGVDWPRNSFDEYHGHAGSCPVGYQAAQDAVSAALAASAEEPS